MHIFTYLYNIYQYFSFLLNIFSFKKYLNKFAKPNYMYLSFAFSETTIFRDL